MDFFGPAGMLIGCIIAVVGYEYDLFLLIPLGILLMIVGAVLLIKSKLQDRRDKQARLAAQRASAIHHEDDAAFNRRALRYRWCFRLCFVGMGALVVLLMVLATYEMVTGLVLLLTGAGIVGLFFLAGRFNTKMGGLKDSAILQQVLEQHFTDVDISPDTLSTDELGRSYMGLPDFDRMDSRSLIKARYHGLAFSVGDINLEYYREAMYGKLEDAGYVSCFRGPVILCNIGKLLPTAVRLWSKYDLGDGVVQASIRVSRDGTVHSTGTAKRILHIEADDASQLEQVLPCHVQDRIRQLSEALNCRIHMAIDPDGRVCVAISSSRDFFRATSWDAAIMRRQFTDNVRIIAEVMDILAVLASP